MIGPVKYFTEPQACYSATRHAPKTQGYVSHPGPKFTCFKRLGECIITDGSPGLLTRVHPPGPPLAYEKVATFRGRSPGDVSEQK